MKGDANSHAPEHVVAHQPSSHTAVFGWMHPATSSHGSVQRIEWPLRVLALNGFIIRKEVGARLPSVPVHVVQSPCVRLFLADWVYRFSRVISVPANFVKVRGIVSGVISAFRSCATGVFPLRLCRQRDRQSATHRKRLAELKCFTIRDTNNR